MSSDLVRPCARNNIKKDNMTKTDQSGNLEMPFRGSLLRDSRGSSALSFALVFPMLLTVAGVATDYGILEMKRSRLQNVADQTAIAAAKELALANSLNAKVKSAADSFARSQVETTNSSLNVEIVVDEKAGKVDVVLREEWTPFFAHFIQSDVTPLVVNATAQLAGKTNLCVLTLDPSGTKALYMDKSARLAANGCAVYSNSNHREAIRLDSDSELSASAVCAVGAVKAKTSAVTPSPTTDCAEIPDPLSSREPLKLVGCDATNIAFATGTHSLGPGRYCGGIKISGDAQVTFEKGDYTIEGAPFEISGKASVKAENTSFYLEGESALIMFTEDCVISMSGASQGQMAGLLFFEDRSVSIGRLHRINSSGANELTGTIYLPRGKLRVDPNASVAQDSAYTAIVAYQLEVDEGPTLVLNSNYTDTNVPVPEGIRIHSQVVLAN
jgi:Flp pilus assembly protein TadG